jgi:hypothetical protein
MKGAELSGKAFKYFLPLEVCGYSSYVREKVKMGYWRSTSQFEVDLILIES